MWLESELSSASGSNFVSASSSSTSHTSKRVKDLSLRESLGSSSNTRLNQTFPLFMEMGLGQVKKQCVNMVYKGPFTTSR